MPGKSPHKTNQVKGILLEEAVLWLLEHAGYRLVEYRVDDPTLGTCAAGLQVRGRGGEHQIDAVADYLVPQPFTFPQRLLVEAKCYAAHREIDLTIVRNALGVFRDVAEFWSSPPGSTPLGRRRYHYQYAVFATSEFTNPAQRFAYAHDINLVPLSRSTFLAPIVTAIGEAARQMVRDMADLPISMGDVRGATRNHLRRLDHIDAVPLKEGLDTLGAAVGDVREAYLAMARGVFPIFLVPAPDIDVLELTPGHRVRMSFDDEGQWYIKDAFTGRRLFSFDIPVELFSLYAETGALSRVAALQLKQDYFSELQFISVRNGLPRLVSLQLDSEWIERLSNEARRRR